MIKCMQFDLCEENGFDGCCEVCPDKDTCGMKCTNTSATCGDAIFGETSVEIFENKAAAIITSIADLVTRKAEIEATEKEMRMQLEAAMVEHSVEKVEHEILKINYIKPTIRKSVDSAKLEYRYPHIYDECAKTSNVKGHVKIELKKS